MYKKKDVITLSHHWGSSASTRYKSHLKDKGNDGTDEGESAGSSERTSSRVSWWNWWEWLSGIVGWDSWWAVLWLAWVSWSLSWLAWGLGWVASLGASWLSSWLTGWLLSWGINWWLAWLLTAWALSVDDVWVVWATGGGSELESSFDVRWAAGGADTVGEGSDESLGLADTGEVSDGRALRWWGLASSACENARWCLSRDSDGHGGGNEDSGVLHFE